MLPRATSLEMIAHVIAWNLTWNEETTDRARNHSYGVGISVVSCQKCGFSARAIHLSPSLKTHHPTNQQR